MQYNLTQSSSAKKNLHINVESKKIEEKRDEAEEKKLYRTYIHKSCYNCNNNG